MDNVSSREKSYHDRLEQLKAKVAALNVDEIRHMPDDMVDPYCDPNHPVKVTFNDVSSAAYRIKGGIDMTPCTVIEKITIYLNFSYINELILAFARFFHGWNGYLLEKRLFTLHGKF